MRNYKGIDVGRIIFAILIPFLHIGFYESTGINIIRQYISRLGVPFFFVVAGMFLSKSVEKYGRIKALKRYIKRIARMLIIWVVIYSPFIVRANIQSIQELLFKTPAFLWYLTGLIVASIPFCLIKNRKALWVASCFLYFVGTLFGDTYKWLMGGWPSYEKVFITTRNGVFFGLPLLCVGELTWKKGNFSISHLLISVSLLFTEITFVGEKADLCDDRSLYFFLPLFIFHLVLAFREWNPNIDTSCLGTISSAIYVMQFGVIRLGNKLFKLIHIDACWAQWIIWLMVIFVPVGFNLCLKNKRITKILY